MKVTSVVHWLGFKSNLKAATPHAKVHRVHVDIPWIFFECLLTLGANLLLFDVLIGITCYLSSTASEVCKIRNACVTVALIGVYVLKYRHEDLNFFTPSLPYGFHQAWETWVWILCPVDGELTERKFISCRKVLLIFLEVLRKHRIENLNIVLAPKNQRGRYRG